MSSSRFSSNFLVLSLGIFFIVLGLAGVFDNIDESIFSLGARYSNLEVIFGIAEIICGLFLLIGFFAMSHTRAVFWGGFIVLIFWIVRIFITKFANGLTFIHNDTLSFTRLVSWLLVLSCELIIASALLLVIRRND